MQSTTDITAFADLLQFTIQVISFWSGDVFSVR